MTENDKDDGYGKKVELFMDVTLGFYRYRYESKLKRIFSKYLISDDYGQKEAEDGLLDEFRRVKEEYQAYDSFVRENEVRWQALKSALIALKNSKQEDIAKEILAVYIKEKFSLKPEDCVEMARISLEGMGKEVK